MLGFGQHRRRLLKTRVIVPRKLESRITNRARPAKTKLISCRVSRALVVVTRYCCNVNFIRRRTPRREMCDGRSTRTVTDWSWSPDLQYATPLSLSLSLPLLPYLLINISAWPHSYSAVNETSMLPRYITDGREASFVVVGFRRHLYSDRLFYYSNSIWLFPSPSGRRTKDMPNSLST